ncbi:MAG: NADPH-dependent 7-cyano-7-deazaguanine reductase QueF [bacterium]|nr:NADPH-dependent 7-cyano-7-deazaguanine reductase QueF [bacterium]
MAKAEGKIFSFDNENTIRAELLEVFPYSGEKQYIKYETKEFSPVCPFSGLPDFGQLIIIYIPKKYCIELKSLKYYLTSYRNVGIYQEAATNRIYKDIYKVLKPKYIKITTVYNTRGGIDTTCEIEKGRSGKIKL